MTGKKILLQFVVLPGYVLTVLFLLVVFFAEWQFSSAQSLQQKGLGSVARIHYEAAVRLCPFNSEYFAGLGNCLLHLGDSQKDKISYQEQAMASYRRAMELNPRNAQYPLMLGLMEAETARDAGSDARVMEDLQDAVANDPNGFNVSYQAGYAGIARWNYLDQSDRQWVLARLRYAIKIHPEYADYIYPRFWMVSKDCKILRQLRPLASEREKRIASERITKIKSEGLKTGTQLRPGNAVRAWMGREDPSNTEAEEGRLYWNGTLDALMNVPAGEATVKICASGTPAHGIYPYMIVELDGEEIGETFLDGAEWKDYVFKTRTAGGIKVLSVTFANDYCNGKEDRNLSVREAWAKSDEG